MKTNGNSKGILYCIAAAAIMALSFGRIFSAFMLVPVCAGFAIAGEYRIKFSGFFASLMGAVCVYIISSNIWISLGSLLYAITLIYVQKFCYKQNTVFSLSIGWAALCSVVVVAGVYLLFVYSKQGNIDLSIITEPIRNFGKLVSEQTVLALESSYEVAGIPRETALKIIEQFKFTIGYVIENIIVLIPAIFILVIMVGTYVSHILAKALTKSIEPKPINVDSIFKMRLPWFVGISYLLSYGLTLFAEGTFMSVLLNYITILELPLLIEGAVVVYHLITLKAKSQTSRVLLGIAVGLTAVGFIINLAVVYVIFGAIDTYTDFRSKLEKYKDVNK